MITEEDRTRSNLKIFRDFQEELRALWECDEQRPRIYSHDQPRPEYDFGIDRPHAEGPK